MKKLRGLISLCLIISMLLSGCHDSGQETGNSAQGTNAEVTLGETGGSTDDNMTQEDTEASTEVPETKKDAVLKESWLYLLQHIEYYDFGQDGYQVSACIHDFDPESDSEIFGGLYYDRSKSYSICLRMGEGEWFTMSYLDTAWANYSESIYLSNLKRSISVLDCRVEKEWNEDLSAEDKENIPQNRYIGCMLGVSGREFLSKNRTTEGEMTAELYLMENQSKNEIGFWLCMEGQEPIYVTVDATNTIDLETDYQVDRTRTFSESVANEAKLKVKIETTSDKPNIEGYWQVETITDFEELPGGYGVTFLEPTDIDGDGLLEEIRQEPDEQGRDAWYLYTGSGDKILLYIKKTEPEYLLGIYVTDVTGDGVSDIVIKSGSWSSGGDHTYYSIWTGEKGKWNRIPLVDSCVSEEYPWMKGNFENLYLKSERLNETQMRVSTVGTDYSEVIELNPEVLDEIWAKDVGKVVWLTVVDGLKSDIRLYGDLLTGETRLGVVLRFGLAELSGRLIYEDGQWSLREINVRQVERLTPDFVAEAMSDTEKWQKELTIRSVQWH